MLAKNPGRDEMLIQKRGIQEIQKIAASEGKEWYEFWK
ncbi:DUF3967 domain-containing protein [Bacillus cereus]